MAIDFKGLYQHSGMMLFLAFLMVYPGHLAPAAWGLTTDAQILLKFRDSLTDATALSDWSDVTTPCTKDGGAKNWVGVICAKGSIRGLQLEDMGLTGKIDVEALKDLPDLRTLSFMNNSFKGPFPDFRHLQGLRSLYLSDNQFSGVLPEDAFGGGLLKLKKLHLSHNQFTGGIPSSLATLTKLTDLRLEGNQFTGKLPEFKQQFQIFNVSSNSLEGPIPESLAKTDSTSFSGNNGLCGEPLKECSTSKESASCGESLNECNTDAKSGPADTTSIAVSEKPSGITTHVVVSMIAALAVLAILGAVFTLLRRQKGEAPESVEAPQEPSDLRKKTGFKESEQGPHGSPGHSKNAKNSDSTMLSFIRDDTERFDLPDLLKASAEILGSGCFGSSYKAALSSGNVMVVKRFKQMNNVGKEEFQEHMRRIGRLSHPNLLSLVAYYYRKEEKLLITNFVHRGSLALHLHGNRTVGQPTLGWPTRLKIVKGIANGLAYLYKELPGIIAAHGHLKSSNVLLNESYEPVLSDYGLVPVINQENSQELMVAYKSPEYLQLGRITKKTDVWSLGILVLEILTGKFPSNFLQKGKGKEEEDLAGWVSSIPSEDWTTVVLDKEMVEMKTGGEGEMVKLLKIALNCCDADVEKRVDLKEVIEKINEIKEKDNDDDFHSCIASEGDVRSSRGMSDDFNLS